MKKVLFMLSLLVIIPVSSFAQTIENLDYISSFNDGFSAIKKDNLWAFINVDGDVVVNFRNDLVITNSSDGDYPIFKNNRCLIVNKKEGISYFGYIDPSGKTVIAPQFLNATNFNNNVAIVLELIKKVVGKNVALDKNVVYYRYFEVTIDTNGNVKNYLNEKGVNVVLDKDFLQEPPKFNFKQISDNLIVNKDENGKWIIKKIIE